MVPVENNLCTASSIPKLASTGLRSMSDIDSLRLLKLPVSLNKLCTRKGLKIFFVLFALHYIAATLEGDLFIGFINSTRVWTNVHVIIV